MTFNSLSSRFALALLSLALASAVGADALVKPVPPPDLSALPAAAREQVLTYRRAFDEAQVSLVGQGLADGYARLGAMYARFGLTVAARQAMGNALSLAPDDGRYYYLLGVFEARGGDVANALVHLKRAYALDKTYLPIRYRLAEVGLVSGDVAEARAALNDVIAKRKDLAPPYALLGRIALREKKYAEATTALREALKIDPTATSLYGPLAEALQAQGDTQGAAAMRAKLGAGEPAFADPLVANVYDAAAADPINAALGLATQQRYDEARKLLDAALIDRPGDVDLLATYARVEGDAGNLVAARARVDAALKAKPDAAVALLASGMVLELAGQEPQAVALYQKAAQKDPRLGEARLFLGNALVRRKQYAQAAEQYRALVMIDAVAANAPAHLAAAQTLAGQCVQAIADVNTQLKSRPRDGGLMQLFVRLAATCPGAKPEERRMAADYAQTLYKQLPNGDHAEALAMALAATGRAKDAVDYQAQAMFEAIKDQDQITVARRKPWLDAFKAGHAVTTPWPPGHPLLAPPVLKPTGQPKPR